MALTPRLKHLAAQHSLTSLSLRFRQRLFWLLPLLIGLILTLFLSSRSPAARIDRTEILWDTWGVPHIYGRNPEELFKAFGWAQMQSHGNLILRLYGEARGRAAEYWGAEYLESDKLVRIAGIPSRAREWYKAQSPQFRDYLDAFAAGINAYVKEHGDLIDNKLEAVLPIDGVDILAHTQRLMHFTFLLTGEVNTLNVIGKWQAGSNGWAIAPSHSASGRAMLLANPHLPWSDRFIWYEAQLVAPEVNAYGATLVGVPLPLIAFNDYLGWTHTVNTINGCSLYELTLTDNGYRWNGKGREFETDLQTLKVKQADGTLRQEPLLAINSIHGPIVAQKDNKALALRVVGLDRPGLTEQYWDMLRAKNLTQFEAALKRLQLPMFTVIYADRDGHIMHLFNGLVPVHSQGDWNYWANVVPGDTSATLWTTTHPYSDLPRVVDPTTGWLQNANDPPWTTTFPQVLNPDKYPPYMAPRGPMSLRAQRSVRMLAEAEHMNLEKLIKYKYSTRMELADRILNDLILAVQKLGDERAKAAARVLTAWDRQTNANSRGAVLFSFWAQAMNLSTLFANPWQEAAPRTTPDGLANPTAAVKALSAASAKVKAAYGALDVAWGDVFRLHRGQVDLPANGGPGDLGIFRAFDFTPAKDGRFQPYEGDSYIAAIEFSNPIRARVLNTYGNATQPGSPHIGDQLALSARQELRPVWRDRHEIEAHLEFRQVF